MFVSIALIAVFSLSGMLIGKHYSNKLTQKRQYFEQLSSLITTLTGEFKFRHTPICELLEQRKEALCPALKDNLSEFCAYAKGESETLELSRRDLSEREFSCVSEFFSSLGKYDLDTQIGLLNDNKSKVKEFYETALEKEKKTGNACIKIGFLCGLGVGILFV